MLGSNNYLGLTGDERVIQGARDALDRYGTGLTGSRLLNGTTPLHLELEERDRRVDGHRGRDRLHHRPPGQRRDARHDPRPRRHGHRRLGRPRLDPRRLPALPGQAAPVPPQPPRQARAQLERAAGDGGGVLVVVDGVFSMEGDVAPLPEICDLCERYGARLMVDEAHGAGVLGARGAGASELLGVEDRVDLRMGTFSKSLASCGGFIAGPAEVIEFLRIQSRAFLFTASAVPAAVGAALAALRIVRSDEGRELMAQRARQRAPPARRPRERGFKVVAPRRRRHADRPGARRGRLEGRPAVAGALRRRRLRQRRDPPGGAAGRRAAAHERHGHARPATLDRALDAFAAVKAAFESEHGPLPGPDTA